MSETVAAKFVTAGFAFVQQTIGVFRTDAQDFDSISLFAVRAEDHRIKELVVVLEVREVIPEVALEKSLRLRFALCRSERLRAGLTGLVPNLEIAFRNC